MNGHVYPNAPLVWTVFQVQHPRAELTPGAVAALKQRLVKILPFHDTQELVTGTVDFGSAGMSSPRQSVQLIHRFTSRDRGTVLSCAAESTSLETFRYEGWANFRVTLGEALSARFEISDPQGYGRVGLRYVDEVRVPGESPRWADWISTTLLPPEIPESLGLRVRQQQSVVQFADTDPARTVTLRYGLADGPSTVLEPGRASAAAVGEYFLFDTDVAWSLPPGEAVPEISVDDLLRVADELHLPAQQLFEWWPTDALRNEVFNRG
ncbi:TIGR04255 family protein [Salana multivorans]